MAWLVRKKEKIRWQTLNQQRKECLLKEKDAF